MSSANVIYKPFTDKESKGAVMLLPQGSSAPTITLPNGKTLTGVPADQRGGAFIIEDGKFEQWAFGTEPLNYDEIEITANGKTDRVPSQQSYEGAAVGSWNPRSKGSGVNFGGTGRFGGSSGGYQSGSTFGGGFVNGAALPTFVDASSLSYAPIPYRDIPVPNYSPINIEEYISRIGANNIDSYTNNIRAASDLALSLSNLEGTATENYIQRINPVRDRATTENNTFNRSEITSANNFNRDSIIDSNRVNQNERANAVDSTGFDARNIYQENIEDARARARGLLPTSLEDRAFEMTARSIAGDDAYARGVGVSQALQNSIDKFSITERLNLSRQGQADVTSMLGSALETYVDAPIKYNPLLNEPLQNTASSDIRGVSSTSPSATATNQLGTLGNLSTINPATALSTAENQRRTQATFEDNTNRFNAANAINIDTTNASNNWAQQLAILENDLRNAALAYTSAAGLSQTAYNLTNQALNRNLSNNVLGRTSSGIPFDTIASIGGGLYDLGRDLFFGGDEASGSITSANVGTSISNTSDIGNVSYSEDVLGEGVFQTSDGGLSDGETTLIGPSSNPDGSVSYDGIISNNDQTKSLG